MIGRQDILEQFLVPEWPLPDGVSSLLTTRCGGHSLPPYEGFNLAGHVGDSDTKVNANRKQLDQRVNCDIAWLAQTHSVDVVELAAMSQSPPNADASTTRQAGIACAVLTADCLPILLADSQGERVAAVHAGWRGLAGGIISSTLARFECLPNEVMAYLGPAISAKNFEVGIDVLHAFQYAAAKRRYARPIESAFALCERQTMEAGAEKYLADLYVLARAELEGFGVEHVYGGHYCTFDDPKFFSYRKDGVTGRMSSLIWKE